MATYEELAPTISSVGITKESVDSIVESAEKQVVSSVNPIETDENVLIVLNMGFASDGNKYGYGQIARAAKLKIEQVKKILAEVSAVKLNDLIPEPIEVPIEEIIEEIIEELPLPPIEDDKDLKDK